MRRAFAIAAGVFFLAGCGTDEDTHKYRVPSSSMEPTLHCARPDVGCQAGEMDFVATHPFGSHKPTRGDIVVFRTPALARLKFGSGGTFMQRLIVLLGDRWADLTVLIYIDAR